MTNYIIYHQAKPGTDCPDGICAAWVAARALRRFTLAPEVYLENSAYEKDTYQFPISPKSTDDIYIVDFSYPKSVLEKLIPIAKSVTILDHHESRMNDIAALAGRILGGYSPNSLDCGATFAWKHFFPDKTPPWFLFHVYRRDTGADGYYDGLTPESEAISIAMSMRRKGLIGEEAFPVFDQLLKESPATLIAEGKEPLKERDTMSQLELEGWKNKYLRVGDYEVPVIRISNPESDKYYSWIGNLLARKTHAPFVAVITTGEPNKVHLRSLASGSNFDVGTLAKKLGGGGHRNASGYLTY